MLFTCEGNAFGVDHVDSCIQSVSEYTVFSKNGYVQIIGTCVGDWKLSCGIVKPQIVQVPEHQKWGRIEA